MKILLVEDNADKAKLVRESLQERLTEASVEWSVCSNATAAKRELQASSFDLMILDVALPLRAEDEPSRSGGVDLLKEVLTRQQYHRPSHVIGLTAFEDIYQLSAATFDAELWSLVYFSPSSDEWADRIAAKVRHIAKVLSTKAGKSRLEPVDIAIVVAVPDELEQVRANGWQWKAIEVTDDATMYFEANYSRNNGSTGRAILAKTPIMGMSAASILATKLALQFRPKNLVMPGICAGDSSEVVLGDLIVGNPVWDYGSGKHVGNAKSANFEPAPYQKSISSQARGMLERLSEDTEFFRAAHAEFRGAKPASPSRLHIGPFASGAAVLANKSLFAEIQDKQHRKLIGID
ncbi:MAG: response regulator, partial [Alphaproteobacteria bacterium]